MAFEMKNDKKKYIVYGIILAILIFLINGIYLKINYLTNYDEFTSLAMIVKLGGGDWSSLVAISDFHGYGHLLPLVAIFKYVNSGSMFYKCCRVWMLFIRIVMSEIIYVLSRKCWKADCRWSFFISIVCSLGTLAAEHQSPISVLTEVPLCFCTLIIVMAVSAGMKINRAYFLIATFTAAFSVTIHARSVIVQIALILSFIILFWLDKKIEKKLDIRTVILLVASFVVFYFILKSINSSLVNFLYKNNEALYNSYETVVSTRVPYFLYVLIRIDQLKVAINICLANFASYVYYSFGLIGIILVIQIKYLFYSLKKGYLNIEEKTLIWTVLFGTLCWIGMCVAIAFTSVAAVQEGNYAWYTYIRYSLPFVCIMVVTSMIIMKKNIVKIRMGWILFTEILICKYFISTIAEKLDHYGYGMKNSMFNSFFYPSLGKNATIYFCRYTIGIITICIIYYWLNCKGKSLYVFAIYLFLSVIIYIQVFTYHIERDNNNATICDKSIELINKIKTENNQCTLYVSGGIKYVLWLQVAVPDVNLQYVDNIKKVESKNGVLLTDNISNYEDLDFIALDDNEYMIVFD